MRGAMQQTKRESDLTMTAQKPMNVARGKDMDQVVINWLLAGFGALIGAVLNSLWGAVRDLQVADTKLAEKVAEMETLVAGNYITRDEMDRHIDAIFTKLDRISDKLDRKVDR
jgi:uncharacterized membrane protein